MFFEIEKAHCLSELTGKCQKEKKLQQAWARVDIKSTPVLFFPHWSALCDTT